MFHVNGRRRLLSLSILACCSVLGATLAPTAHAEFPERPVTLIVPCLQAVPPMG